MNSKRAPAATVRLDIAGLGIVLYAPEAAADIPMGADHLTSNYLAERDVQRHVQAGSLVGFGMGSPGTFVLRFWLAEPPPEAVAQARFALRLGIVTGGSICCRDLYDLMDWTPMVPRGQTVIVPSGTYRVTLLSTLPESGTIGDGQEIQVFLERIEAFPLLRPVGIPHLMGQG